MQQFDSCKYITIVTNGTHKHKKILFMLVPNGQHSLEKFCDSEAIQVGKKTTYSEKLKEISKKNKIIIAWSPFP